MSKTISNEQLRHELRRLIQTARSEGIKEGRREAWREGTEVGASAILLRWAQQQFGDISLSIQARIELLTLPQLKELADVMPQFKTEQDLDRWLDRYF